MKLTERERQGLTVWTLLYGKEPHSFETLVHSNLTGYFIFEEAMNKGWIVRHTDPDTQTYATQYKLTDFAISIVKGEHDEYRT